MGAIDLSRLVAIEGFNFPLYASPGAEARARAVGERAERAIAWLTGILGPAPTPAAFVVGPGEWPGVTELPIYGLPHVDRMDDGSVGDLHWKMVMGAEPGGFWRDVYAFIWTHLDPEGQADVRGAYGDADGFSACFPDLIVVHELAHLFQGEHGPAELDGAAPDRYFPRQWVSELFANLALYGYLAEVEPSELQTLETICLGAGRVPRSETPVRALDDMYRSLEFQNGAVLYCWYQFLLIMGAKRIWQRVGRDGLRSYYQTLNRPDMSLSLIHISEPTRR